MKKLLLFAALGAMGLTASADYTDYFKVMYEGNEVANGGSINAEVVDYSEFGAGGQFEAKVDIQNESGMTSYHVVLEMRPCGLPSWEQYKSEGPEKWGMISGCLGVNCFGEDAEQEFFCFGTDATQLGGMNGASETYAELHDSFLGVVASLPENYEAKTLVRLYPDVAPNDFMEFTLVFTNKGDKVNSLTVAQGEAEYYNLQGVRVANPEQGQLYIVRQNGKVQKQILK